ncbi:MAG: hypothetical protein HC886_09160 [Leptolyngbyaceae cyanobacterium SM1_1_3]|nr:hypothetical protein [Leptolyngbyaceae cyanobacterium SM1_1_3]
MLRHSSVNGAGIETATTLKAPLKSALGSLSITLDEELTRYRRQRQGHPMPPARRLKVKTQKPLNLITVKPDPSRQPATASPSILEPLAFRRRRRSRSLSLKQPMRSPNLLLQNRLRYL